MVEDDSYEVIPHQILADLKAEVSVLKEKLMGPDKVTAELVHSMQDLQQSLKSMKEVFQEVLAETKTGEEDDEHKAHDTLMSLLGEIKDQNEQIARGMVAIADMVEKSGRRPMPPPRQRPPMARVIPPMPPRGPPPPPRGVPPPMHSVPPPPPATGFPPSGPGFEGGMPPPPPPKPKKKSLLGSLFKKKK